MKHQFYHYILILYDTFAYPIRQTTITLMCAMLMTFLTIIRPHAASGDLAEVTMRYMSGGVSDSCQQPTLIDVKDDGCNFYFHMACGVIAKVDFSELDDITGTEITSPYGPRWHFQFFGRIEALFNQTNTLRQFSAYNLHSTTGTTNIFKRMIGSYRRLRLECSQ